MLAMMSNLSGWRRPIVFDANPPIEIPMIAFHENVWVSGVPAVAEATSW